MSIAANKTWTCTQRAPPPHTHTYTDKVRPGSQITSQKAKRQSVMAKAERGTIHSGRGALGEWVEGPGMSSDGRPRTQLPSI